MFSLRLEEVPLPGAERDKEQLLEWLATSMNLIRRKSEELQNNLAGPPLFRMLNDYFLTNPGERPLNPNFGGGLGSFIFEQIQDRCKGFFTYHFMMLVHFINTGFDIAARGIFITSQNTTFYHYFPTLSINLHQCTFIRFYRFLIN